MAELAPTLYEGQLRLLLALASLTERTQDHTASISTRELSKLAKLSESALPAALKAVEERALITVRHGGTIRSNRYMVNFFTTRRASFGEAPPAPFREAGAPLLQMQGVSFTEAPPN